MAESRVHKSILNAKVNTLFYLLTLILSFVSRKIFLNNLGDEFIGLTGTLNDFISFLSLSEMGIGTAIAFNLYGPLQKNDQKKISELISLFGFFFRRVGIFVGVAALVLSFFFPIIFNDTQLPFLLIFVTFYSFVSSSLITYLLNYRQIILSADQRQYVVTGYYQSAFILKTILQIFLAYKLKNLYLWVLLEFIFSWVACLILNYKINVTYPWLRINLKDGKFLLKKYPEVLRSSKQVFIHSLKTFLINRCDQLLVFVYVSLDIVAHYGNYLLIITKSTSFFNSILGSTGASIGNLIAEGNQKKILKVFWELTSLQLIVGGILFVGFFFFVEPFIRLWLGSNYVMPTAILILLIISNFLSKILETVNSFNHAYGNYADVWTVWVEGGLFIIVTLCTAPFLGIMGILLGRISSLLFDLAWKPYYLFHSGVKMSVLFFWKGLIRNLLIFIFCFVSAYFIHKWLDIEITNFFVLIVYSLFFIPIFIIVYVLFLFWKGCGAKELVFRIPFIKNRVI